MPLNDVIKKRLRVYSVRKYTGQTKVNGRPVQGYSSTENIKLHIQPLTAAEIETYADGKLSSQDLKAYAMPGVILPDESMVTYKNHQYVTSENQDWNDWGQFKVFVLRRLDDNNSAP